MTIETESDIRDSAKGRKESKISARSMNVGELFGAHGESGHRIGWRFVRRREVHGEVHGLRVWRVA